VNRVIDVEIPRRFPGLERHHTPHSDHFFNLLRPLFRTYVPSDAEYDRLFDRFEYLRTLVAVDLTGRVHSAGSAGTSGGRRRPSSRSSMMNSRKWA
jgi:hypothetical protein